MTIPPWQTFKVERRGKEMKNYRVVYFKSDDKSPWNFSLDIQRLLNENWVIERVDGNAGILVYIFSKEI